MLTDDIVMWVYVMIYNDVDGWEKGVEKTCYFDECHLQSERDVKSGKNC